MTSFTNTTITFINLCQNILVRVPLPLNSKNHFRRHNCLQIVLKKDLRLNLDTPILLSVFSFLYPKANYIYHKKKKGAKSAERKRKNIMDYAMIMQHIMGFNLPHIVSWRIIYNMTQFRDWWVLWCQLMIKNNTLIVFYFFLSD